MSRHPREGWSPDLQVKRDELARDLRVTRKARDQARKKEGTVRERLASLVGRGTAKKEAESFQAQVREELGLGRGEFLEQERKESVQGAGRDLIVLYQAWQTAPKAEHEKEVVAVIRRTEGDLKNVPLTRELFSQLIPGLNRAYQFVPFGGMLSEALREIKDFYLKFVQENVDRIKNYLTESKDNTEEMLEYLIALGHILREGQGDPVSSAGHILREHIDQVVHDGLRVQDRRIHDRFRLAMYPLINDGNKDQRKRVLESLKEYARRRYPEGGRDIPAMWDIIADREDKLQFLDDVLDIYGLDPWDTYRAWIRGAGEEENDKRRATLEHLRCLCTIEHKEPGSAKLLSEEYSVKAFGRYPPELLVRQVREHARTDLPYGIIMYPRHDHNGVFMGPDQFLHIAQKLKDRYAIRAIEVESRAGIARKLLTLNRRYGRHQKISFAIVGGHGEPESIQFGDYFFPGADVKTPDLAGKGVQRMKELFTDGATIVLRSCSTGAEGGIAQKLSEAWGVKVIAPQWPSLGADVLDVNIEGDNQLEFSVTFVERTGARGAEKYMGGRKIG